MILGLFPWPLFKKRKRAAGSQMIFYDPAALYSIFHLSFGKEMAAIPALKFRLSRQRSLSGQLRRLSKNIYVSALTALSGFLMFIILSYKIDVKEI